MTKYFSIIIIGLLFTTTLFSQDYKKDWIEGKLIWQDFNELETDQGVSELKYFIGYNSTKQKKGDTIIHRIVAECYVDKNLSWIHPDYKTDQYLRYNQVIFDIVEYYRRSLQYELDRVNYLYETENKYNVIFNSCNNEITKFQSEADGGQNINSIDFWEQKLLSELRMDDERGIPEFSNRNFGYGLHAGFGSGFFTGTLGEYFSPTFNFIFGFDFAYKNSIFFLNATLAGNKLKKDYASDKNWYEGQNATVAIMDLSYGYAFINNERFKLTPFAGLGITEFSSENKDNQDDNLRIVDYNVIFGINADYKIRTKIGLIPNSSLGVKEKVETSIRTRLYITRANYHSDLQGYSINLTIGIGIFGNMIRLSE